LYIYRYGLLYLLLFLLRWLQLKLSKNSLIKLSPDYVLRLLGLPVDLWVEEADFPPTVYLGHFGLLCCLLLGLILYLVFHFPYALLPPHQSFYHTDEQQYKLLCFD
jgi:hypothetical protein